MTISGKEDISQFKSIVKVDGKKKRKIDKISLISDDLELERKLKWPVRWEKVVQIDCIGRHPIYGIEEKKNKNFMVNGVITHNTTQISVARTLFELGKDCNIRIKIVTNADGKSTDILTEISGNIKRNERIHEVFPKLRVPSGAFDNRSKLTIERTKIMKDPSVEAIGIMTSGSGSRSDRLIGDDVCNFRNSILEDSTRELLKKIWDGEFVGQHEPQGKIVYICTPWSGRDLTAKLQKLKVYEKRYYAIGEDFQPIWPSKWSREYLKERWRELGDEEFDRQYRNKVISEGARAISEEAIRQLKNYGAKNMPIDRTGFGIDPGMMRATGAKSAIFVMGYKDLPSGGVKMIPQEIREGLWTAPQLVKEIKDAYRVWEPQTMKVESNGFQLALAQWLEDDHEIGIRIEAAFTSAQKKQSIETGVKGMGLSMERGQWLLPLEGHKPECTCALCRWVRQLEEYPYGERDDMVMASWICSSGEWQGRPRIRSL